MTRPTDSLQSVNAKDLTKEQCLLILDQIASDWGIKPLSEKARAQTGVSKLRGLVDRIRKRHQ